MTNDYILAAQADHSDADCFVCAILSHGEEGYVYGTNGRVTVDSIVKNFKGDVCPTLAGKPKLFFIQVRNSTSDALPGTMLHAVCRIMSCVAALQ